VNRQPSVSRSTHSIPRSTLDDLIHATSTLRQQSGSLIAPPWRRGRSISATLSPIDSGPSWALVGISAAGAQRVDASNNQGIVFTLAGDLGGCSLSIEAVTSLDESAASDPCRGACAGDTGACAAPSDSISQMGRITDWRRPILVNIDGVSDIGPKRDIAAFPGGRDSRQTKCLFLRIDRFNSAVRDGVYESQASRGGVEAARCERQGRVAGNRQIH
jgi:hypothetical protein